MKPPPDTILIAFLILAILLIVTLEIFAGAQERKMVLPILGSNVIVEQTNNPPRRIPLSQPSNTNCNMSAARREEARPVAMAGSVTLGRLVQHETGESAKTDCPERKPGLNTGSQPTHSLPQRLQTNQNAAPSSSVPAVARVGASEPRAGGSIVTPQFLRALAEIESGSDSRAVGRAGERTQYQISRAAWTDGRALLRAHASTFPLHTKDQAAPSIARAYLQHLESRLATAHRPVNPANLYAAWNLGWEGFRRRGFQLSRCPATTRDAARRLENLLQDR